jgi:hypothetical protein
MKRIAFAVIIAVGTLAIGEESRAAACADGVYRAACVGANGAAVARKPTYRKPAVSCANGPYRAGCAGPNGATVVRKPY